MVAPAVTCSGVLRLIDATNAAMTSEVDEEDDGA